MLLFMIPEFVISVLVCIRVIDARFKSLCQVERIHYKNGSNYEVQNVNRIPLGGGAGGGGDEIGI